METATITRGGTDDRVLSSVRPPRYSQERQTAKNDGLSYQFDYCFHRRIPQLSGEPLPPSGLRRYGRDGRAERHPPGSCVRFFPGEWRGADSAGGADSHVPQAAALGSFVRTDLCLSLPARMG